MAAKLEMQYYSSINLLLPAERDEIAPSRAGINREREPRISNQQDMVSCSKKKKKRKRRCTSTNFGSLLIHVFLLNRHSVCINVMEDGYVFVIKNMYAGFGNLDTAELTVVYFFL